MGLHLTGNKRKIVNNLLWATGGKVINLGGSLILGIIVARYLGPEQYGLMNYVISFAALFAILPEFGLGHTVSGRNTECSFPKSSCTQ